MQNLKWIHFYIWLTKSKFITFCHKWKNQSFQLCKTEWLMTETSSITIFWMRLSIIWVFICSSNKSRRIYKSFLSRTMRQLMSIIIKFIYFDKKSRFLKKIRLINFSWSCYSDSLACFLSRTTSAFKIYWMIQELLKTDTKTCLIIIFISTEINKSWFLSSLINFLHLLKQFIQIAFFLFWSYLHFLFYSYIWIRSSVQLLASQKIELMHDMICRWI